MCLLMLDEIMKNERMEREGEEPEVYLETRYKKNWKGLEGSLYEKWWRGFKQEIHELNLEHPSVCLQNV